MTQKLYKDPEEYAGVWNFGPNEKDVKPVSWILDRMIAKWPGSSWKFEVNGSPYEAEFLKLDISKAKSKLNWNPVWELDQTLERFTHWHQVWLDKKDIKLYAFQR